MLLAPQSERESMQILVRQLDTPYRWRRFRQFPHGQTAHGHRFNIESISLSPILNDQDGDWHHPYTHIHWPLSLAHHLLYLFSLSRLLFPFLTVAWSFNASSTWSSNQSIHTVQFGSHRGCTGARRIWAQSPPNIFSVFSTPIHLLVAIGQ